MAERCAICRRQRLRGCAVEPLYPLVALLRKLGVRQGANAHVSCIGKLQRGLKRRAERLGKPELSPRC